MTYFEGVNHIWLEAHHKTMVKFKKCTLCCDWSKPPTMLLPLQTTASIFLDKPSSTLSVLGCLPLWSLPSWVHGCRPITSRGSWCSSRSHTSRGSSFSLNTFILMQLPAFLRALTASWWVAACMLRPLTWKDHGHITLSVSVKVGAGVRGEELSHTLTHSIGYLKIACIFPLQTVMKVSNQL